MTPQRSADEDGETLRFQWKRPVDLGRAVGLSATQVRTYEQVGFIPPADRSPSGYRRYGEEHLAALRLARTVIAGYGWQTALEVMCAVHADDFGAVYRLVDEAHAAVHRQRAELATAGEALTGLSVTPDGDRAAYQHVGAAAKAVGLKPSAVRFWESVGLLDPVREQGTGYRLYDAQQVRRLRIIALLRDGRYRFDRIRRVLDNIDVGRLEQAQIALQDRQVALDRTSERAMRATAALHAFLAVRQRGGARQTRP